MTILIIVLFLLALVAYKNPTYGKVGRGSFYIKDVKWEDVN